MTIDLNAVRALADAATGWTADEVDTFGDYGEYPFTEEVMDVLHDHDAAFIAAARSLVPALCDEVERLWTLCATHDIDPEGCEECFVASAEGRAAHV